MKYFLITALFLLSACVGQGAMVADPADKPAQELLWPQGSEQCQQQCTAQQNICRKQCELRYRQCLSEQTLDARMQGAKGRSVLLPAYSTRAQFCDVGGCNAACEDSLLACAGPCGAAWSGAAGSAPNTMPQTAPAP